MEKRSFKKRVMAALVGAIVLIVTLPLGFACGGGGGAETGVIKLASVVPISGAMAGRFDQITYSMQYLADEINDGTHEWAEPDGGLLINGTTYTIDVHAEDSSSALIYNSFLKLTTEDYVVAAFGSASASGVLNCQPITEEAGLIYVSYAGAGDLATMYYKGLPSQFFFRMVSLDEYSMGPKYEACFVETPEGDPGPFAGLTKVFRLETTDAAGQTRDEAARDWVDANPQHGIEIIQTKFYTMGQTMFGALVQSAIDADTEVLDVGGMRDVDMISLLKECDSKGYDGKVFATSGGGANDSTLWTVFEGDTTKYDFVYSLYHPGDLEEADPAYVAWTEARGGAIPDWMEDAYEYALSMENAPGDAAISDPLGFAKCYSVARAIVESIMETGVVTLDYEGSLELAAALGEKTMYDLFGPLEWGGEETFGRKCALDYNWHLGRKGGRMVDAPAGMDEDQISEPEWIFALSVHIP